MESKNTSMRIGLIGNLAGGAYMMLKPLRERGVDAHLLLSASESGLARPQWEDAEVDTSRWLHEYGYRKFPSSVRFFWRVHSFIHFVKLALFSPALLRFSLIQSFTGTLFQSPVWEFLFGTLKLRPYIACATGSDIRELAFEDSPKGERIRRFYKNAARVLLLNFDMVELTAPLGLDNTEFFPFAIDTDRFSPRKVERRYASEESLLFFMPSHLDWGVVDSGQHRNSTKGNDRFFRALARFIGEGGKAHAVVLDRGPDREPARQLVRELGLEEHITFLPQMKKDELVEHFQMADVVVDQFDVGSFGTTTLEAMSCEKPVLVYCKNACAAACYPEMPPVLGAHSENEIFEEMRKVSRADYRTELGAKARAWIEKYHKSEVVSGKLADIYSSILREGNSAY